MHLDILLDKLFFPIMNLRSNGESLENVQVVLTPRHITSNCLPDTMKLPLIPA